MFTDPIQNIADFGVDPGSKIADLGAGSGFYTLALAKAVGDTGKIFAVEVQKELLEKIRNDAERQHLSNIEYIWGDIERFNGTKIGDRMLDAVILSNILFQVEDKQATVTEAVRILRPGGRLLCIDWTDSFGGMGPTQKMVFPKNDAKELLEKCGLTFEKEFNPGAHHYALVFKKS